MSADALRDFALRDRVSVEESKQRYWTERKRSLTAEQILHLSDALRMHARMVRSDWPSDRERSDDVAVHCQVSEALSRAARSSAS